MNINYRIIPFDGPEYAFTGENDGLIIPFENNETEEGAEESLSSFEFGGLICLEEDGEEDRYKLPGDDAWHPSIAEAIAEG